MTNLKNEAIFGQRIIAECRKSNPVKPNDLIFADNSVKIKLSCRGHNGRGRESFAVIDKEFTRERPPVIEEKNPSETDKNFVIKRLKEITTKNYTIYSNPNSSIKADLIIAECNCLPNEAKRGGANKRNLVKGSATHHSIQIIIEGNKPVCYTYDDRLFSINDVVSR